MPSNDSEYVAYWRVHRADGYVYRRRFATEEDAQEVIKALYAEDLVARPYNAVDKLLDVCPDCEIGPDVGDNCPVCEEKDAFQALMAAQNVEECDSSSIHRGSPFGV